MEQLDQKLREYQLRAGQWLEQKRTLENQAREAGRQAELLHQRIAGIQEAIEVLGPKSEDTQTVAQEAPRAALFVRKRSRRLSGSWQQIMQLVDGRGSFNYEALAEAAEIADHAVGRDTLRSQMSLYKQTGFVEAAGDGKFRLTESGRRAAGITTFTEGDNPQNENGAHDGNATSAPETGPNGNPDPTFNLQPPND